MMKIMVTTMLIIMVTMILITTTLMKMKRKAKTSVFFQSFLDINECSEDKCDAKAVCENTRGSYTCKCKTGFAGDGYQCILDEVYAQKQEINQIIIIGASTAGGSLLIILLIACLCCVNPKKPKPKPKKKKKAPKAPAIRDEWAADSSGSSGDSE